MSLWMALLFCEYLCSIPSQYFPPIPEWFFHGTIVPTFADVSPRAATHHNEMIDIATLGESLPDL